jgi:hypothetical protein
MYFTYSVSSDVLVLLETLWVSIPSSSNEVVKHIIIIFVKDPVVVVASSLS